MAERDEGIADWTEATASQARSENPRRPYEPPTLIRRGALSTMVAATVSGPGNQLLIGIS
jgi:hypothetical protein